MKGHIQFWHLVVSSLVLDLLVVGVVVVDNVVGNSGGTVVVDVVVESIGFMPVGGHLLLLWFLSLPRLLPLQLP